MKTKLIILILLITSLTSRANLIDLTPGGFSFAQGLPPPFINFIFRETTRQITFFDSSTPDGFVSLYGELNGGTYFTSSMTGPEATVSWDFGALPGFSMSVLLVEGNGWGNLYDVPEGFKFVYFGDVVTLNGELNISSIAFYGRTPNSPVVEGGSTFALMGIGLLGILLFGRGWKHLKTV